MDLPMDVVFDSWGELTTIFLTWKTMLQSTHIISPSGQTAMYITPKNLLHLSRLSKRFRSMFTSRSAIFIWKTAICNVDLDCYEDINEIQFASLLYDKFCMVTFSLSLSLFFFFRTITWFMFPLFRHADEGDARLIQWFVWGCVQSVKLRSNSFQSFFKYYCRVIIFFCNLVHKNDLLDQYPEATSLIKELPASLDDKCFKPQAHMLIEKVFSLKKKPLVIFLLKIW